MHAKLGEFGAERVRRKAMFSAAAPIFSVGPLNGSLGLESVSWNLAAEFVSQSRTEGLRGGNDRAAP
jgi:hypothetical protein